MELFYSHPCLTLHETCYIDAPRKSVALKINGQTFENKIEEQLLKDTS